MKLVFALIFALALLPAHAAETCDPPAAKYIHAGQMQPGNNWVVWWWCTNSRVGWMAIIPDDYTSARVEASAAYALGVNPGYRSGNFWRPADDPLIVSMRAAVQALATADTDRPPAEVWLVGATGKSTTRPTYPVANGVRSKTSDGRAPIGTPCDCSKPTVEGKTTYCPLATPWQPGPVPDPAAPPTATAPNRPTAPPTVLPAPPPSVTVCVKAP